MNTHRSICQRVLCVTLVLSFIGGTARAGGVDWGWTVTRQHAQRKLHYQLFGDYGPFYVLTGIKPIRIVNGRRVPPREGMFSPAMRRMAGETPYRGKKRVLVARGERFNDLNLSVNVPGKPWAKLDPAKHGTRACLLLSRRNPDMIISLRGEPVGIEAGETDSSLLAASQEKMKSLPGGVVQPGVRKLSAPGIVGRAYRASATFDDGTQLQYSMWVATKNGYNYTLAVYGDPRHQQAIDQTMKRFVGRMRQIQSSRVAHATGEPTVRR